MCHDFKKRPPEPFLPNFAAPILLTEKGKEKEMTVAAFTGKDRLMFVLKE